MLECKRCRHLWKSRQKEKPKVCPKCKSPYWDISLKKINRTFIELFKTNLMLMHDAIIETSGGLGGVRDEGGLYNAAYKLLKNFNKKPDFVQVGAQIFDDLAKKHYFFDGNKRTAYCLVKITLMSKRLHLKVNYAEAVPFIIEIAKADSKVTVKEIEKWLRKNTTKLPEKEDLVNFLKILLYDLRYGKEKDEK